MELVTQCRMFCKGVSFNIGKTILFQYYCGTQKLLSLKEDNSLDKKNVLRFLRVFWKFVKRPMKRKTLWFLHLNYKIFLVMSIANKVKN